ncbi:hypothetical protein [Dipodfec virus UOA04_Rod_661]|nr:hypothetical protein [Dipodfec virus UOA04_Rod_661]
MENKEILKANLIEKDDKQNDEREKIMDASFEERLLMENDSYIVLDGELKNNNFVHNFVYDKSKKQWVATINHVVTSIVKETYIGDAIREWRINGGLLSDMATYVLAIMNKTYMKKVNKEKPSKKQK